MYMIYHKLIFCAWYEVNVKSHFFQKKTRLIQQHLLKTYLSPLAYLNIFVKNQLTIYA